MTMEKLAELAGVSVSTVSKAFSGSKEISEKKRDEIFRIAKEHGCYDKYCKSIYQQSVIAVVFPEFQSGYYAEQLSLLEKEIKKRSGIMLASCTDFDAVRTEELITYLTEYAKVDGVIVYGDLKGKKYSIPVITIGGDGKENLIFLSNEKAIADAVHYFKENGHKRIAYVGERYTYIKKHQFIDAMKKFGMEISEEYVFESSKRFEFAGYEGLNQLLELENPPTAVLAAYDAIAIGAMKSIYEHGLKIPEDISIIGMDDIKECEYLKVPLTSITTYNEDWSEIIVDNLFEQIESGNIKKPKKIKLYTELVKRDSVGKVKKQ